MTAYTSTAYGLPTSGQFTVGDTYTDAGGAQYYCTRGGSAAMPGLAGSYAMFTALPPGVAAAAVSTIVAAAGTDNTNAGALTTGTNVVTGADNTKGVILPTTADDQEVMVVNADATHVLKVYPAAGSTINALTATTGAFSVGPASATLFTSTSATQIYTPSTTNAVPGTVVAGSTVVVDSNKDITGFRNVTLTGLLTESAVDALTAHAGGTQGAALALTKEMNRVTVCATAGDSVSLPASAAGLTIVVINSGAASMQVYGAGTDTIDDVATATGVSQMPGSTTIYTCTVAGKWYTEGLGTGWSGSLQTMSYTDGITANVTQTQAAATVLASTFNRVSTNATAGNGVRLPASAPGLVVYVLNDTALPVQVYGAGTDTIGGVATATGVSQMQKSLVSYSCVAVGNWLAAGLGTGFSGSLETVSAVNSLTAFAGGGQGSAVPLTATINRVTTVATIGDSVKLPASAIGLILTVSNAGAQAMDVFPFSGEAINANAANVALRINSGTTVSFWCSVAGTWHSSPTPVVPAKFTTHTYSSSTAAAGDLTGAAFVTCVNTGATPGTLTTRTATQMFQDAGNVQVGDSYKLRVANAQATGTLTVGGAAAGVTYTGTMTVAANTSRDFNVTFNSATTCTIQNECSGVAP